MYETSYFKFETQTSIGNIVLNKFPDLKQTKQMTKFGYFTKRNL
jgi:hypothetical protein